MWVFTNCKKILTHVHLGFKLYTLMPEDGQRWPKHAACIVGFNKFVVLKQKT